MNWAYLIIAAIALERAAELVYARRNTRALLRRGGIEAGRGHYPFFVALHAAWLAAILFALPAPPPIHVLPLALLGLFLLLRLWVIASLGPFWTTRIVTLPDVPLVKRGPYRWLRHPNYLVVSGEIALLPLVFGLWRLALLFSLLNLVLIVLRIRVEDAALAERRRLVS